MPVTPHSAAGWRMEPPVSVAVAKGARRAATAAAEPPEEPPGTRLGSQGFLTGPYQLVSFDEPIANSSMFALPIITIPASRRRLTTVASYGETKFDSIREPQVVSTPAVQKMSLWTIGTPVSGPASPAARRLSATAAASSARSAVTVISALRAGWVASARLSASRVSSTEEYFLPARPADRPASVSAVTRSLAEPGTALLRPAARCAGTAPARRAR